MNKIFTFILRTVCLLSIPVVMHAQVPNAGFENWTNNEPDGWATTNVEGTYTNITKSSIAHSENSAVKGEVVAFFGFVFSPIIQSGPEAEGFPYTGRPGDVTGYLQFHPAATGDRFGVNIYLYKGGVSGTSVAVAAETFDSPITEYTKFSVPFTYFSSETPDTCIMQFLIVGPQNSSDGPAAGSYFLLDDLSLSGATAVKEEKTDLPSEFKLYPNYPNPFNPTTNISFSVPAEGRAVLKVYNILGEAVATLFDGVVSGGNIYHAKFNGESLTSGIYFSNLQFIPPEVNSGFMQKTNKMILSK